MSSVWQQDHQIKMSRNVEPYIYQSSTTHNPHILHCIFFRPSKHSHKAYDIYKQYNTKSGKFVPNSNRKIRLPDSIKIWNRQYYIKDNKLFCLSGDGNVGDLWRWMLSNIEIEPVKIMSNLSCASAIFTHTKDALHIIGTNNHFIYQDEQMECISTSFVICPQAVTCCNDDDIILLDDAGFLWVFDVKSKEWIKLDIDKLKNVNWCTQLKKTVDKKHLFILSGGENKREIYVDNNRNFLDQYNKQILRASLPLHSNTIIKRCGIKLPIGLPDCQVITRLEKSQTREDKCFIIVGFLRKNIPKYNSLERFPAYLQCIIAAYFVFEIITIFSRKCKFTANVDNLFT